MAVHELLEKSEFSSFISRYDTFLFDCDGVLWHGNDLIPNVKEVLAALKAAGKRILYVTNNASKSRASYAKKFKGLGIEADAEEIFGSAFCAAFYMENNLKFSSRTTKRKVYVCGMKGICEELEAFNIPWCGAYNDNKPIADMGDMGSLELDDDVGAVLVGFDLDINYRKIAKGYTYLRDPETIFLATNDDLTYPSAGTTFPGAGSLLNVLVSSSNRKPLVLGKPHPTMLDCIVDKWHLDRSKTCMVGDRLDTDIAFGKMGSVGTLLVLTGVTSREALASSSIKPDYLIDSLGSLNAAL